MDPQFWLDRWTTNDIGFHQKSVHDLLERYWPEMPVPSGSTVFVPLCGKSLDMVWLTQQGHDVFGVELSRPAVEAFFTERGLKPQVIEGQPGNGTLYLGGPYAVLAGDFFATMSQSTQHVRAVYDRASLVALPPAMREPYAKHLMSLISVGTPVLLISLDYDQTRMKGPPFAVSHDEIKRLFSTFASVRLLEEREVIETHPHFKARGLTSLKESAVLVIRT
jgi:thiopurine S-methyltransferase